MNKNKIKSCIFSCFTILLFLLLWINWPIQTKAAEAAVSFGSVQYEWKTKEVCPIGIYFNTTVGVSSYSICLEYDPEKLRYLDGADRVEGNQIFLDGGGGETGYKRMLHFEPVSEGGTAIRVLAASGQGTTVAEDGTVTEEELVLAPLQEVPVMILKKESGRLKSLNIPGAQKMEDFSPDLTEYHLEVPDGIEELEIEFETEQENEKVILSDTGLQIGENEVTITVGEPNNEPVVYTLYVKRLEPEEISIPLPTEKDEPVDVKESEKPSEKPSEKESEQPVLKQTVTAPAQQDKVQSENQKLEPILALALLLVSAAALISLIYVLLTGKKNKELEETEWEDDCIDLINLEQTIIDVRNVSMNFRLAQDEASSLKEYLIRTIKGKNRYRTLQALRNVSFEVKQSEVIGIIGTNGSGKSTLLKIIAGALKPSEGEVVTDHKKVQMLTLGTGFDMELTARENVYLNGAIIGYTKDYIDEKFKDIVAFAELEGFMDERMKNFSSGMVSRLGFAIATMRDTPEILILDEVLSVGDMFFRNKSEKRIQEMIRTGAAVLIVSHSADVITKNCDKAVWLDKGVLRMVGEPKEVCKAYAESGK